MLPSYMLYKTYWSAFDYLLIGSLNLQLTEDKKNSGPSYQVCDLTHIRTSERKNCINAISKKLTIIKVKRNNQRRILFFTPKIARFETWEVSNNVTHVLLLLFSLLNCYRAKLMLLSERHDLWYLILHYFFLISKAKKNFWIMCLRTHIFRLFFYRTCKKTTLRKLSSRSFASISVCDKCD